MDIIQEKAMYGIKKNLFLSFFEQDDPEQSDTQVEYEALVILENGDWLLVRDDGTAIGHSGTVYARVSEEVEAEPLPADDPYTLPFTLEEMDMELPKTEPIPDTDLVTLGWTTESDVPLIMIRVDGELRVAE